jgi:DNA-binding NarL/FixJ family response regulator
MITVLLADDHVYIRKTISYLLGMAQDIKVVDTASNGKEAIISARFNHPDVVVMDISMPVMDGIEATRQILAELPETRVLMLSSYSDLQNIKRALHAGAVGYMVKDSIASEILVGIRSLFKGKRYFSSEIADKVSTFIEDSDS